jgi:hypothetical protein
MQQSRRHFPAASTSRPGGTFNVKTEAAPIAANAVEHLARFALVAKALLAVRCLRNAPDIAHSQEWLCYS